MQMFLISDNIDTQTGMKIAGVDGIICHEREEVQKALEKALANPNIGVLLLTEKISLDFKELIDDVKKNIHLPLIVEVPDRHGTKRDPEFLTNYVKDAIGLKL